MRTAASKKGLVWREPDLETHAGVYPSSYTVGSHEFRPSLGVLELRSAVRFLHLTIQFKDLGGTALVGVREG